MEPLAVELVGGFIVVAHEAHGTVAYMKLQPHLLHLLGADQQNAFAVQHEEVGAFPHLAVFVMAGVQNTHEAPMDAVVGNILHNGAAAVGRAAAHHGVIFLFICLVPDLGIPEVYDAAACGQIGGGEDGVLGDLLVVDAVADGHALDLAILKAAVFADDPVDAGVHQQVPAVGGLNGAAGETAVFVIFHIRSNGDRQPLPADEVLGFRVTPVHGTPVVGIGVILEKKVVFIIVAGEAVGVVDPAHAAGDMESGTVRIGDPEHTVGFVATGLLKLVTDHRKILLLYFVAPVKDTRIPSGAKWHLSALQLPRRNGAARSEEEVFRCRKTRKRNCSF